MYGNHDFLYEQGLVHYLSDRLATLHYHTCKIFAIIITPEVYPEMSNYTVTMASSNTWSTSMKACR